MMAGNPRFSFSAPPPLSLYIHFPWCVHKCPYCDFNSHAIGGEVPETAYVDALLKDLEQELPAVWGRTVQTVFMGGGTPSLFSAAAIDRLLAGVRARLPLSPEAEITLEANPGTVEQAKFSGYREAGVNRLSIGIQSLNDAHLQALERIHNADEALRAAQAARNAGFDNFNLDLMFGLPQQGIAQAVDDLQAAFELQPAHLSWYQLTLEPNTAFHAHPPPLPDDEHRWNMQQQGHVQLVRHGYTQYEVSAFARDGKRCRHNLNYWRFGDYMGIGAGAHGKVTDAGGGVIRRRWKQRHPRAYLAAAGTPQCNDGERELTAEETVFEFALNRLRLNAGFALDEFESRCGLPRECILPALQRAVHDDLLTLQDDQVQHTDRGWQFLNDLLEYFLPEDAEHA
ncbi:MAG TPA: radical SAM family heme chaperone HemW [Gammaproteobacteria bacterium]|nr:radical SAM family heme chaperone HemW [Gammaproteobacteria bacterium]